MELTNKNKLMQELALLLIYLSSWEEKAITGEPVNRAWKGYDFDILDSLMEKELIDFSFKARSLTISEEGMQKARLLLEKFVPGLPSDNDI
ncbi:MAG TPA: DUF6429 family protein [Chitinophagaceae bacterium]|nr:DUF6429 family protein [Chitinophagaceae bacterium]